jgi:hypothetical protein
MLNPGAWFMMPAIRKLKPKKIRDRPTKSFFVIVKSLSKRKAAGY